MDTNTLIVNKYKSQTRLEEYHAAASDEPSQSRLTVALAARRRGTHEKFTAAVDKGTVLTNDRRGKSSIQIPLLT